MPNSTVPENQTPNTQPESTQSTGYKNTLTWNLGFSAYWFATSYKWFILLFILLPAQVSEIVPGGEKNTAWGLILGTGAIWALFGPALFGRLSETSSLFWRNRRPWLAIGAAGTCIALFTILGAPSLPILAIGYFLLQVSDDLGTGPYAGMVADTVPKENRGYSSSILGGLKLFGQIASAVVALILGQPYLIFIGIGLVNLLAAGITIITIKDVPPRPIPTKTRNSFFAEYLAPFKNHDFLYVWLNRLIVAFAFACISAYTRNFLEDMFTSWNLFGLDLKDPNMAANVLALSLSFAGIIGSIFSAKVSDKYGRKPLLIGSALMVTAALIPIAFIRDFSLIWVFVFIFGIGNGVYHAADWALISDILPNTEKAATEMGAWQSSETAVQIPSGIIMGFLIDQLNRQTMGLGYQAMIIIAALFFFASVFLVKRIKGSR